MLPRIRVDVHVVDRATWLSATKGGEEVKLRIADDLSLPADEAVTQKDLAWAAGCFEGEGTITIGVRNSDETYRLICILGNTDEEMIDFFHSRWPGYKQPAYGKRPGRKPAWYWTVIASKATAFLVEIEPYIRTKRVRRKLDLALEFQSFRTRDCRVSRTVAYKDRQRGIYQAMRALNKRGVAA